MELARKLVPGRSWIVPALVFATALAMRLAYVQEIRSLPDFERPLVDAGYHDYWGWGLASGEWDLPAGMNVDPELESTPYFRPPLPAYWLAALFSVFGRDHVAVRVVQALLGAASCLLVWRVAGRMFDRVVAGVAGFLAATYWILPYFDTEYREVTLLVFLYLASILALLRYRERPSPWRAAAVGLLIGLATLAKPNGLLLAVVAAAWMFAVTRRRHARGRCLAHAGTMAGFVALVVAPVTVRNAVRGGDLVLISSNGGINLYIGNNPEASGVGVALPDSIPNFHSAFDYPEIVRSIEAREGRDMRHSEVSQWFAARAREFALENPGRVVGMALAKASAFWAGIEIVSEKDLVASRRESTVLNLVPLDFSMLFAATVLGLVLAALVARAGPAGCRADGARLDRAALLLVVAWVGVYYLSFLPFFVTARYRAPILPLLMPIAAYGVRRTVDLARGGQARTAALCVVGCLALYLANMALSSDAGLRDEADTLAVRGAQLAQDGKADEAERVLRQALEANPGHVMALNNLAMVLLQRGATAEAVTHLETALAIDDGDYRPHQVLGLTLVSEGRFARGQEHLLKAQSLATLDPQLPRAASQAFLRAGRPREAIPHLEHIVEQDPERVAGYIELGRAHLSAQQPVEAEAVFRQATDRAPTGPVAHHMLGVALLEQGRQQDAIAVLEQALSFAPGHAGIAQSLARARGQ